MVHKRGSVEDYNSQLDLSSLEFLTKRELFAAMAMQGLLSIDYPNKAPGISLVGVAVDYADALLAALSEGGGE